MYLSFEIKSFQVNGAKAEAELAYSLQAAKVEDLPPHSPSNNPRSRIFALSPPLLPGVESEAFAGVTTGACLVTSVYIEASKGCVPYGGALTPNM